jgi:hypothetical protein
VKITTAAGGAGGLGGDGQLGGDGGAQGNQGGPGACPGGVGGQGGRGGSGGGGAGGPSVAIAVMGAAVPDTTGLTLTPAASAAAGALGGNSDVSAKGADGLTCKTLEFGNASSCTQ